MRAECPSSGTLLYETRERKKGTRTRRKEKIIHPTKSHFPTVKGMKTQPLSSLSVQDSKIEFDQVVVVNMVMAVKISNT